MAPKTQSTPKKKPCTIPKIRIKLKVKTQPAKFNEIKKKVKSMGVSNVASTEVQSGRPVSKKNSTTPVVVVAR